MAEQAARWGEHGAEAGQVFGRHDQSAVRNGGAGVALELALTGPEQVASLLLSAPGGSLIAEVTPDLARFIEVEDAAMAAHDLDGAVEANLKWWVDGPQRKASEVNPMVRDLVRRMQRRAFDVTADWDDIEEDELDPPALDRLAEFRCPPWYLSAEWISKLSTTPRAD